MVDAINLIEQSKEDLSRIILEQDKRIKELEQKVKEQQDRHAEKFAKANTKKRHKKRPGRKAGHVGITRHAPEHIDEVIEEALIECPECHHSLGEALEVEEQVQEDIVPAHEGKEIPLAQVLLRSLRGKSESAVSSRTCP